MFRLSRTSMQAMYQSHIQGRIPTLLLVLTVIVISMWLRANYPVFGIWASHDDALFLKLARKLQTFKWLGSYDQLTLAKGAFFPFFLAVFGGVGFPVKLLEHFLYLLAVLLLSQVARRLTGSRLVFVVVFCVLAFSPLPWMFEGGARVTREPLYQILTLLVFAYAAMVFLKGDTRISTGRVLGVVAAFFWLTREEGVWLLPAIAVLALPWLLRLVRGIRAHDRLLVMREAKVLVPPFATFLLIVFLVNSINWVKYGVFRNNDFRAGPFAEAYGALARIETKEWQRYVVFPNEARQLAYTVSPAAQELASYLEGSQGKAWAKSSHGYPAPWGCVIQPESCNEEILSAWFVWALRDAVSAAGHYRSASDADLFYRRLSQEINQACERQVIPCREMRASLIPPWRDHYFPDTLESSLNVFRTLASLNRGSVGVPPSILTEEQERFFTRAIHEPLSGKTEQSNKNNELRVSITKYIAHLYATVSLSMFWGALGVYFIMLLLPAAARSSFVPANALYFLSALLAAISARVVLLGFLEATAIPSNNLQYLIPAVPLYLGFVVMSISLGVCLIAGYVRRWWEAFK